ncbi:MULTISPECIES: capsular polysaccharide synthesis protein [unclassified Moraxella]|uniref:capsular polysaccharide synthesis protein n=1 Tax=unclassified Moraxella TaxID=2685852 RepID=UPI003AF70CD4
MAQFNQFIFDNFSKKPFKPFYNLLVPRATRKQWQFHFDEMPRQEAVAQFWQQAIMDYEQGKIPKYEMIAKQPELVGQKIIWQYWGQGLDDLPEVARLCFASVDKFKGDYQVIRLTDNTFSEYLDLPLFLEKIRQRSDFRPAYYADILRTALLVVYGGVWLDASVLMTDKLPKEYTEYGFFVYSRCPNSQMKHWAEHNGHCYFNWHNDFKVNYLNSIIFTKPNSQLASIVLDLLLYFWQANKPVTHYFFYQILLNELKVAIPNLFNFPIIDDTLPHLLQDVIEQEFNPTYFENIKQLSTLHKLSLHGTPKIKVYNSLTYYGFLNTTDDKF